MFRFHLCFVNLVSKMPLETINTVSPATGEVILSRHGTSLSKAQQIAKTSAEAFATWKTTPLAERKSIVAKGLAIINDRKEKLGDELTTQMGRPIAYSAKEIETMQKRADYLLDIAEEALRQIPGRPENGFTRYITKEPVGPTLIVFAWNVSQQSLVKELHTHY